MPLTDAFDNTPPSSQSLPLEAAFDNTAPQNQSLPLEAAFDNTAPTTAVLLPGETRPSDGTGFDNTPPSTIYGDGTALLVSINAVAHANVNLGLTLAGVTIGGKNLSAGNVVLLMAQDDATQNGLYLVNVGVATRHTTMDTSIEANSGASKPFGFQALVIDAASTDYAKTFVLTTPPPITLGTTLLTWAEKTALARTF